MASLNDQIVEALPHLKRYAWFLERNHAQAEDLVQDCVERALAKSELFQEGTNMRAWMFTMMRNIFINGKRRRTIADRHLDGLKLDGFPTQSPSQFHSAMLSRTQAAIETLSQEEREAVMALAVEQRAYEEMAAANGAPTGTLKSRLSRARSKLRAAVLTEDDALGPDKGRSAAEAARRGPA